MKAFAYVPDTQTPSFNAPSLADAFRAAKRGQPQVPSGAPVRPAAPQRTSSSPLKAAPQLYPGGRTKEDILAQ